MGHRLSKAETPKQKQIFAKISSNAQVALTNLNSFSRNNAGENIYLNLMQCWKNMEEGFLELLQFARDKDTITLLQDAAGAFRLLHLEMSFLEKDDLLKTYKIAYISRIQALLKIELSTLPSKLMYESDKLDEKERAGFPESIAKDNFAAQAKQNPSDGLISNESYRGACNKLSVPLDEEGKILQGHCQELVKKSNEVSTSFWLNVK